MRRVALRGLLGRKLRSVLTALAIVIGVAMVSGTFVLTDTIDRAFHAVFTASYAQTDAVVSGKKLVDWSTSGNATVSPSLLAKVRGLPEVGQAAGLVLDFSQPERHRAAARPRRQGDRSSGSAAFGFGIDAARSAVQSVPPDRGPLGGGPGRGRDRRRHRGRARTSRSATRSASPPTGRPAASRSSAS